MKRRGKPRKEPSQWMEVKGISCSVVSAGETGKKNRCLRNGQRPDHVGLCRTQ